MFCEPVRETPNFLRHDCDLGHCLECAMKKLGRSVLKQRTSQKDESKPEKKPIHWCDKSDSLFPPHPRVLSDLVVEHDGEHSDSCQPRGDGIGGRDHDKLQQLQTRLHASTVDRGGRGQH